MKILFILIVVGYVVFEGYALTKISYRAEPLYIFDQFLSANHAVRTCGAPEEAQLQQFERNLRSVTNRAAKELRELHPDTSAEEIEQMISARDEERRREVDAIVRAGGCSDPQMKTLLKRFEIRARLRVG
jgi:hypothetical protein